MLIDDFIHTSPDLFASPYLRAMVTELQPIARTATVVRADNVAHYLFVECPQEKWDLVDDFPCVTPPFPVTWIEWRQPALLNSHGTITQSDMPNMPMAFLFRVVDMEKEPAPVFSDEDAIVRLISTLGVFNPAFREHVRCDLGDVATLRAAIREMAPEMRAPLLAKARLLEARTPQTLQAAGARWIVHANYFMRTEKEITVPSPYEFQFFLQQSGRPMLVPGTEHMFVLSYRSPDLSMPPDSSSPLFFVPLLTFSFLNCKNVQRITQTSPQLNKARLKKGKPPVVSYYTLEIDPMKTVLRTEGQSETVGLKRALHITRGHFADYTAGKGLFGKYHGQYWVPQHVKGAAAHGRVEKNYAVNAPHEGGRP